MHELPVAENLLEIALRHAGKANASKITDLYLVIGQLSSIIDDSIQFYWEIIAKDTIAEGAILHFKRIPTKIQCLDCDHQYPPSDKTLACPICNSISVKIISGEEFFLEAINVEN
ncbi:MAG: hydrogenase maturation nickel metallochaperone HypA [Chloroflexota bacterium]|nr:MAG: hydrogenase maturation nickel metallochaperone HypA [Chloroflexota bacterium]